MTETWLDIRTRYASRYGDQLPGPRLEEQLVNAYQNHPALFTAEADRAAATYAAGKIHSPWPILAERLNERITNEERYRHVTGSDATEREHAIRLAERWLITAGAHLPDEASVIAELFQPEEMTADLDLLEHIDRETADTPGRTYYGALLEAQIRRTREHGPQPIPGTAGRLARWDTPDLRHHVIELWRRHRIEPA
jgi:hypothetical protein